jgi:tetratricopeptide (TPR) repeat protein
MMPSQGRDWFRRSTWSADDERAFRAHLKRARRHNRPQYLRIQAACLIDNGLPQPALRFLDEVLSIAPGNVFLTIIHEARAVALADLGLRDEAIGAYRAALAAQRARPNVEGYAALGLAELVVRTERRSMFDEALEALDTLHSDNPFPAIQYREAAVRALIAQARGDNTAARRHALRALDAANTARAPFARHPGLGLVREFDPTIHARLQAICAA